MVEDEAIVAADMRRNLIELGYEVLEPADSAEEAIARACEARPDLALVDVHIKGDLDGIQTAQILRERFGTPAIYVTAYADEATVERATETEPLGYLLKPIKIRELRAAVEVGLYKHAIEAQLREREQQLQAAHSDLETANGELARALSELEELARTDPVTGLPNRRSWDDEVPRELVRADRSSRPLCVALIDLDHLKAFNDTHGHQAGDTFLSDAGAAWRMALRVSDFIARFGGDEFAVLMPDCPLDHATAVIERVCAATPHDQTSSAGVACWDGTETPETLIGRADDALYAAKQAGRARAIASPTTASGSRRASI